MLVLINGLPLFSKRLADDLNAFDTSNRFIFCDTYNSKVQQLKFLALLPFADVVISMNGVTDYSGSLNAVLRLKKKLIMQWQGTDSLMALERFKNGTIKRDYIDYASHFVDFSLQYDEVSSIGVKPEYVYFKSAISKSPIIKYERISCMTYMGDSRQAFYGINQFKLLAEHFPDVDFKLFGVKNPIVDLPFNVKVFGWVSADEFQSQLRSTPIFLRLTEHDGFSLSVIEAMSYGCEVMWTFPYQYSYQATTNEQAIQTFEKIQQLIINRGLTPNQELIEETNISFDYKRVMSNYISKIKEVVCEKK